MQKGQVYESRVGPGRPEPRGAAALGGQHLAHLLFDKLDVLADLRIVLLEPQLLGAQLLVLGSGVEVAGAGTRDQLDLVAHLGPPDPSRWSCYRELLGKRTRRRNGHGHGSEGWRGRRDSNPRPPA